MDTSINKQSVTVISKATKELADSGVKMKHVFTVESMLVQVLDRRLISDELYIGELVERETTAGGVVHSLDVDNGDGDVITLKYEVGPVNDVTISDGSVVPYTVGIEPLMLKDMDVAATAKVMVNGLRKFSTQHNIDVLSNSDRVELHLDQDDTRIKIEIIKG